MDSQLHGMTPSKDLRDVRHDSPMATDGPNDNSLDIDVLRESVLASRPAPVHSAILATSSRQTKVPLETTTEGIISEPLSPQRPISILAMKSQNILPAPIPLSIPESVIKTEEASQNAKARVIEYSDRIIASTLRTAQREYQSLRARKSSITQELADFEELLSQLQPEDKISCIEYVNSRLIYEHNKTDRLGKNLIEYLPYPDDDVAVLRQTYSLATTPLAEVFRMAESLISWPVEFKVRLPLIRKQQLEDLASGFPEASKSWPSKMVMDFEQMWTRLCRWHNGSFTKQHEDWVNSDLVDFRVGRIRSVDDEVVSLDGNAESTCEVVRPSKQVSPESTDVDVRDEKPVNEAQTGNGYDSPTPGCEFCNRDRAYRPRCPDFAIGSCEDCNRRCSCGFLPSHIPRKIVK